MARPPKHDLEQETVTITETEYRELKKAQVLLTAVKNAGYLEGRHGDAVMAIANLELGYHLM